MKNDERETEEFGEQSGRCGRSRSPGACSQAYHKLKSLAELSRVKESSLIRNK